jgi:hypothetical protein
MAEEENKGVLEKAGDWAKEKLSNIPGYTKPLTDVTKAIAGKPAAATAPALTPPSAAPVTAAPPAVGIVTKTPQQLYEAKEKYANRNNPHYNVDNSGLTKEPLP